MDGSGFDELGRFEHNINMENSNRVMTRCHILPEAYTWFLKLVKKVAALAAALITT